MDKGKKTTLIVVIAVVLVIAIAIAAVVIFYINADNIKEQKIAVVLDEDNKVVAEIMDTEYKYSLVNIMGQYENAYGIQDASGRQSFWNQAQEGVTLLDQIKEFALEQTKYQKVEYIKAQENNITLSKEEENELQQYYDSLDEQFASGDMTTEEYLETYYNVSYKQFKRVTKQNTIAGKFSEQQMATYDIADDELKERYEEAPENYDTVGVRHILLTTVNIETGEALDEETVTEKEELANELLGRIQSGEDMIELVGEYSEDSGKDSNDGLYNINISSNYVESFKEWALNAEVGDMGIVESSYGYHVVSCESRTDFEDVKANVKQTVKQEKYSQELAKWVEEYEFEVYDNVYDEVNPLVSK